MNKFEIIAIGLLTPFMLFVLYGMFIWTPVNIYTEAKCLEQGYPESRVSVGLEQYCMNLDGLVTVRVDKQ